MNNAYMSSINNLVLVSYSSSMSVRVSTLWCTHTQWIVGRMQVGSMQQVVERALNHKEWHLISSLLQVKTVCQFKKIFNFSVHIMLMMWEWWIILHYFDIPSIITQRKWSTAVPTLSSNISVMLYYTTESWRIGLLYISTILGYYEYSWAWAFFPLILRTLWGHSDCTIRSMGDNYLTITFSHLHNIQISSRIVFQQYTMDSDWEVSIHRWCTT
jgi:hypothetical protein